MTNREKSFLLFMVILALLGILLLSSCSPSWHLKRAIDKGADVKSDTIYTDVVTERTITDTLVRFQNINKWLAGDTVTINTVRWRLKERIDTVTKTRYLQVECKPDTVRVISQVNTEISAGYSKGQLIGSVFGALLFAGLIGYGTYKLGKLLKQT